MLPGTDGLAVCATLRDRGCWAPVLRVTARDQVPDRVRGLDAGADDYLAKPFAFDELLARLRALLRRAPGRYSAALPTKSIASAPPSTGCSRSPAPTAAPSTCAPAGSTSRCSPARRSNGSPHWRVRPAPRSPPGSTRPPPTVIRGGSAG